MKNVKNGIHELTSKGTLHFYPNGFGAFSFMKTLALIAIVFVVSAVYGGEPVATGSLKDEIVLIPLQGQKKLYVKLDFSKSPELKGLNCDLRLKPEHSDIDDDAQFIKQFIYKDFPGNKLEVFLPMEDYFPAKYRLNIRIFSGEKLIYNTEKYFDIIETPEWLKKQVGIEALSDDYVLPPFSPVTLKDTAIGVWNRNYKIGAMCLPEEIETQGAQMLDGPVRIEMISSGKDLLAPAVKGAPKVIKQAKGVVHFSQENSLDQFDVTCQSSVEYDGLLLYSIEIRPKKEIEVSNITLHLPIKSEFAPYLWAGGNYQESSRELRIQDLGSSKVISGDGVQWESPFKSSIWLGDDERGLSWSCETEQYWYPQPYKERPQAQQIIRKGDRVELLVNMVSKPCKISKPVTYKFALMGTPVRPFPKGWRNWKFLIHWHMIHEPQIDVSTVSNKYPGANMAIYWPSWRKWHVSHEIRDPVAYQNMTEKLHKLGVTVLTYTAPCLISCGTYDAEKNTKITGTDFSMDKIEWKEINPVMKDFWWEWIIYPLKGDFLKNKQTKLTEYSPFVSPASTFADYRVWQVAKHAELGSDGIGIFDGGSLPDNNILHGAGYYDENGVLRSTSCSLALRNQCKRMLYMYNKIRGDEKKRITGLGLDHTHVGTSDRMYAAFFDAGLKGEDLNSGYWMGSSYWRGMMKKDKYFHANMLTPEQFRIEYTGKQFGWVPVFMPQLTKSPGIDTNWANSAEGAKDFLVMTLLHDVLVLPLWCNDKEVIKTWQAKDKFGMGDDDVEYLPYWRNQKYVTSSNDAAIKVTLYRKNGKIFVVACNLSKEPAQSEVKLNLAEIASVNKISKCFDAVTDEPVAIDNGNIKVSLPPRDYRLVIVQ